jgi:hypothetical protein
MHILGEIRHNRRDNTKSKPSSAAADAKQAATRRARQPFLALKDATRVVIKREVAPVAIKAPPDSFSG